MKISTEKLSTTVKGLRKIAENVEEQTSTIKASAGIIAEAMTGNSGKKIAANLEAMKASYEKIGYELSETLNNLINKINELSPYTDLEKGV